MVKTIMINSFLVTYDLCPRMRNICDNLISQFNLFFLNYVYVLQANKIMRRGSSMQSKANKETISTAKTGQENVRVTRSRAKAALGASISPSKPTFKQAPMHKKRMASDDIKDCCQHKRRSVLKDVTNSLACLDGNNVKVTIP